MTYANAKARKRCSLNRQIAAIDGEIAFWASMHQWRVNLGQLTTEQALDELEPLKAARNTLKRLLSKRTK